jgi:hypothetical protein
MPHDIVNAMRTLREEMRQRLLQAPEYRAFLALERSIEEIDAILREAMEAPPALKPEPAPVAAHPAVLAVETNPQPAAPARHHAIAAAFAETLAAKMDQRSAGRPAAYPLAARAAGV